MSTIKDLEGALIEAREQAMGYQKRFRREFNQPVDKLGAALKVRAAWSSIPQAVKDHLPPELVTQANEQYGGGGDGK